MAWLDIEEGLAEVFGEHGVDKDEIFTQGYMRLRERSRGNSRELYLHNASYRHKARIRAKKWAQENPSKKLENNRAWRKRQGDDFLAKERKRQKRIRAAKKGAKP